MIKIYFLIFYSLLSFAVYAQFNLGLDAYNSKKYTKAIAHFKNELKHQETAAAHYNLALSYFQNKNYIAALSHFENTLKIKPNDENAMYNAVITNEKIVAEEIWTHPYSFLERFIYSISPNTWLLIIYVLSALSAVLILVLFLKKSLIKVTIAALIFTLCAFVMANIALSKLQTHLSSYEFCYAKNKQTSLLLSPDGLKQPEKMEYAKRYKIVKQNEKFFQIETAQKQLFWVENNKVWSF